MSTQNATAEEIVLLNSTEGEEVEEKTINDYKKLNEKCDIVISKIKDRKDKKTQSKK